MSQGNGTIMFFLLNDHLKAVSYSKSISLGSVRATAGFLSAEQEYRQDHAIPKT